MHPLSSKGHFCIKEKNYMTSIVKGNAQSGSLPVSFKHNPSAGSKNRLSVFDSIAPVYWASVFFGTLPLYPTGTALSPLKKSRICTAYSTSLLFIALTLSSTAPLYVIQMYQVDSSGNSSTQHSLVSSSKMVITMKIISPLLSSTLSLICLFNGLLPIRRGLSDFLARIEEVDLGLSKIVRSRRRDQLRCSRVLFFFLILIKLPFTLIYGLKMYQSSSNNWFGLAWSSVMVFFIISGVTSEIQFVNCAYLLYIRFKSINDFLSQYVCRWTPSNWSCDLSKKLPRYHSWMGALVRDVWSPDRSTSEQLTLNKLERVHQCHRQLSQQMQHVNTMYQLVILVSLFSCFSKHVFNMYFILFGYLTSWRSTVFGQRISPKAVEPLQLAYSLGWCTLFLVRFLLITLAASYTSAEAVAAKSIVSELNNRYLNPDLKEELYLFLGHVSSKQMKFSACGFFKLNRKLITSAVAAATTYLVILIQFHPHVAEGGC